MTAHTLLNYYSYFCEVSLNHLQGKRGTYELLVPNPGRPWTIPVVDCTNVITKFSVGDDQVNLQPT